MFFGTKQKIASLFVVSLFSLLIVLTPSSTFATVTIDPTFTSAFVPDGAIGSVLVQPDGKILVYSLYASNPSMNHLIRLNSNGSIDTDFSTNMGTGFDSGINNNILTLQPDGKILVGYDQGAAVNGGYYSTGLVRLNSNGSVDSSFMSNVPLFSYAYDTALQSDGKIIVVGSFGSISGYTGILRLNTDGTLDTSFSTTSASNTTINTVEVLPDDSIFIGGDFTTVGTTSISRIARLNSDGTINTSFSAGTGFNFVVLDIVYDTSLNNITVGGQFTSYNSITRNRIARLALNGILDTTTFAPATGCSTIIRDIEIQPDDKPIFVGLFSTCDSVSTNRIARFTNAGARDATFSIGTGFSSGVLTLDIQPDHKIVVGGGFATFNGTAVTNKLVRLIDDSIDATAPTVSITTPSASSVVSTWTPSVSWGDSTTCEYNFDSASYSTVTCGSNGSDISAPSSGSHTLNIRGTDTFENSATTSVSFTYTPDTTPPAISITSPTAGTISSWSPVVSWGDASLCEYDIDSGGYTTLTCASNGTDITTPSEGAHTITIRGTDSLSNSATSSVTFTYTIPVSTVSEVSQRSSGTSAARRQTNLQVLHNQSISTSSITTVTTVSSTTTPTTPEILILVSEPVVKPAPSVPKVIKQEIPVFIPETVVIETATTTTTIATSSEQEITDTLEAIPVVEEIPKEKTSFFKSVINSITSWWHRIF